MLKNLRALRVAKKMTQSQLSEASKINRINISQYEIGIKNPNLTTSQKLASALGVTVDELIGDTEMPKEKTG